MPDAEPNRIVGWEARQKRLVARRVEINSTQQEVADRAGLTQSYVGRIEVGLIHAERAHIRRKLAKGLRVSLAKLDEILEGP